MACVESEDEMLRRDILRHSFQRDNPRGNRLRIERIRGDEDAIPD